MPSQDVGVPIPQNTPHAVSVTLPTWEATVSYEEGEEWVTKKMTSGYPRFFIHSVIQDLAENLQSKYGREGDLIRLLNDVGSLSKLTRKSRFRLECSS